MRSFGAGSQCRRILWRATIEPEMCFTIGENIEGPDVTLRRFQIESSGWLLATNSMNGCCCRREPRHADCGQFDQLGDCQRSGIPVSEIKDIDETEIVLYRNEEECFAHS